MLFSLWFQACDEEVQNPECILNNLRPATQLPRQFRWGSDFSGVDAFEGNTRSHPEHDG